MSNVDDAAGLGTSRAGSSGIAGLTMCGPGGGGQARPVAGFWATYGDTSLWGPWREQRYAGD
jgi:hypothetical protein